MATGMSKAKARRNSRTKATGYSRAKLSLPAKAGKRRPHNIKGDGKGSYIAADFKPRPKVEVIEKKMFIMDYSVPNNPPGKVDFNKLSGSSGYPTKRKAV